MMKKYILSLASLLVLASSAFAVDMKEFSTLHPAGYQATFYSVGAAQLGYTSENHLYSLGVTYIPYVYDNEESSDSLKGDLTLGLYADYKLPVTERIAAGPAFHAGRTFTIRKDQAQYDVNYILALGLGIDYAISSNFIASCNLISLYVYSRQDSTSNKDGALLLPMIALKYVF